ncbi:hypothetical protein ACQPZ2_18510 [Nocardia pseudovaccinii]|uniref:hypothetical protein n=1 Tax=Nocardia pseudovaccinii TaxID=189540 RepID=UPI003D90F11A
MSTPFRTPRGATIAGGSGIDTLRQCPAPEYAPLDCGVEPRGLTYRQAREILHLHEVHGPQCRQWLAAAAYLSAGLDDE